MHLRTKRLLGLILFLFAAAAYAQPSGGGPGVDSPLTGVEYLLGAGALYGLKRIIGKRKNRIQDR